jgi:hypothetical protein
MKINVSVQLDTNNEQDSQEIEDFLKLLQKIKHLDVDFEDDLLDNMDLR